MSAMPNDTTLHRYISADPAICDGKPVISGTRIRVAQVAIEYDRLGWTPDQIVEAHPHLTLAEVHDALSYYYENQATIDADISAGQQLISALREHYPSKVMLP
jgi:uncharacterized protein (DUF433 family)